MATWEELERKLVEAQRALVEHSSAWDEDHEACVATLHAAVRAFSGVEREPGVEEELARWLVVPEGAGAGGGAHRAAALVGLMGLGGVGAVEALEGVARELGVERGVASVEVVEALCEARWMLGLDARGRRWLGDVLGASSLLELLAEWLPGDEAVTPICAPIRGEEGVAEWLLSLGEERGGQGAQAQRGLVVALGHCEGSAQAAREVARILKVVQQQGDAPLEQRALWALYHLRDEGVELERVARSLYGQAYEAAAATLSCYGERGVAQLAVFLRESASDVEATMGARLSAARVARDLGAVEVLRWLGAVGERPLRHMAWYALAERGDDAGYALVCERLEQEGDVLEREELYAVLGMYRRAGAYEVLSEWLKRLEREAMERDAVEDALEVWSARASQR